MDRHWEREPFHGVTTEQLARIFARSLPRHTIVARRALSGGRRNSHHAVDLDDGSRWVLRLYAQTDARHEIEAAVHALVARDLPVPRIIDAAYAPDLCALPFAVLEYIEGTSLDVLALEDRSPPPPLFFDLGCKLALVHMHHHERIGFFDPTLRVVDTIPPLVALYEPFAGAAAQRLGSARHDALLELVRRHRCELAELDQAPALVHGDFRPANVLVREGEVAAVLDWEFAMAGHTLADIGQFLRDEDELVAGSIDAFVAGYEKGTGTALPVNWRLSCRLRDLLNLLQMLKGDAARPRQHAEALQRIDRTLRLHGMA